MDIEQLASNIEDSLNLENSTISNLRDIDSLSQDDMSNAQKALNPVNFDNFAAQLKELKANKVINSLFVSITELANQTPEFLDNAIKILEKGKGDNSCRISHNLIKEIYKMTEAATKPTKGPKATKSNVSAVGGFAKTGKKRVAYGTVDHSLVPSESHDSGASFYTGQQAVAVLDSHPTDKNQKPSKPQHFVFEDDDDTSV